MHCHFGNLADIDAIRDKSPSVSPGISPRKAMVATLAVATLVGAAAPIPVFNVAMKVGTWYLMRRVA